MRVTSEPPRLIGQRVLLHHHPFRIHLRTSGHRKKEFTLGIPELLLNAVLESASFLPEDLTGFQITRQRGDLRNCHLISPHVCIERGSERLLATHDVLGLAAVDVELHPVVMTTLPEHFHLRNPATRHPPIVIFH